MKTILIVDDEQVIREILQEYLRRSTDYIVLTAIDSDQALEHFNKRQIDLMVTNIIMNFSIMNGIELTRYVTERYDTKVIVYTAMKDYKDEAFDAGAIEYVMKPVKLEIFLKLVKDIVSHSKRKHKQKNSLSIDSTRTLRSNAIAPDSLGWVFLLKRVIMGFFKKLLSSNKDKQEKLLSFNTIQNAHEVFVGNHANPPFVYLKDKYSLEIDEFSKIADILNGAAIATAEIFEEESSFRANDYLVHYFFDLYLSLNSGLFQQESGIASAIIDGIHFKYYGQPSQKIISSQIQLWAEKERCFLSSFFSILKEDDYPRLLAIFAYYCISEDGLGATEGLMLSKLILNLMKQLSPKLKTKISNIL